MSQNFRKQSRYRKPAERVVSQRIWPGPGNRRDTPWGRCVLSFDIIFNHINSDPAASVLLAAGTSVGFSNMHRACEYYLPQAAGVRRGGVWSFPNGARLRIAKVWDDQDMDRIMQLDFSLIAVQAEGEAIALLQPLLTLQGRIIPFLGNY